MAETRTLTGTVTYRDRMALPAGATVEIRLIDVSRADAPARVLAKTSFTPETQVPVAFSLDYDDGAIVDRRRYGLRARILLGAQALFVTTRAYPAFTGDQDGTEILVERVAAASATPAGRWLAEDIGGGGVVDRLQTILEIADDGAVTGSGGCNRMTGKAEITGAEIRFGPLAATNMLCTPAVMDQEGKFFAALDRVRSWQVDPTRRKLVLRNAEGEAIVSLARQ